MEMKKKTLFLRCSLAAAALLALAFALVTDSEHDQCTVQPHRVATNAVTTMLPQKTPMHPALSTFATTNQMLQAGSAIPSSLSTNHIEVATVAGQLDRLLAEGELLETKTVTETDANRFMRISIYKTPMKYPYIRVEEIVEGDPGNADQQVILERLAMVADHALVKVEATQTREDLVAMAQEHGLSIRADMAGSNLFLVSFPSASIAAWESAFATLSNTVALIQYAEPDYIVFATQARNVPNDTFFSRLWGMNDARNHDIDAPEAWAIETGSSDVIVGVIDSGVDYNHPDLAANMWKNTGEVPNNNWDDDGNGYVDDVYGWNFYADSKDPWDDGGHGTHCSGTIGAVGNNGVGVAGVCWNVKIMALKFMGNNGGNTSDAVDAIYYATRNGAKLTSDSWGGTGRSQSLIDAIQDADNHDILFVAAAGNDGVDNDAHPHYPSSYPQNNIIAVAASDSSDQLASFSHYGRTSVDLAAPGVDIGSTYPDNDYVYMSGTSMATPHVAGACALLWSHYPDLSAADVRSMILENVDTKSAFSGKCVTGGRLNVYKALTAQPPQVPPAAPSGLQGTPTVDRIELQWQDQSDNEDGFYIERHNGTRWQRVATAGANRTAYTDTTVTAGTRYRYRIQAYNASGVSDYSGEISVTIPGVLDDWDSGDDQASGATALPAPSQTDQSHGPHTLSISDAEDWFSVSLQKGNTYRFYAQGSGDTYGTLYRNNQYSTPILQNDNGAGNRQFMLNYTADDDAIYKLRVSCPRGQNNAAYTLHDRITAVVNRAPSIRWRTPADGAVFVCPAFVSLQVDASDSDGIVTQVVFRSDSQLIARVPSAPFSINYLVRSPTSYSLSAVAYDDHGATATARLARILFKNAPTISFVLPDDNTRVPTGSSLDVSVTASGEGGAIDHVSFYVNSRTVGSDTTAPYTYRIVRVGAGRNSLQAEVVTTDGLKARTPLYHFYGETLPEIRLTSPVSGTSFCAPANVPLTATASDPDDVINRVIFRAGSQMLATLDNAPYTFNWKGITAGTYTLTAEAYDQWNGCVTSAPVMITVTNPVPAVPSNAVVHLLSGQAVRVQWQQLSSCTHGFELERSVSNQPFAPLVQLPASSQDYIDTSVVPSTWYAYRLRATNESGTSDWVETGDVRTPADNPGETDLFGHDVYTGAQHGVSYALAVSADSAIKRMSEVEESGRFALTGLPWNVSYHLSAFMDATDDETHDTWEPIGVWSNSPLLLTNQPGSIDIVLTDPDSDGDGLPDFRERQLGTDVNDPDTDGDGMSDYQEVYYDGQAAYDPYHVTDHVGGRDTDAFNRDTDEDGWPDGTEVEQGSNPLDPEDPPVERSTLSGIISDDGPTTGRVYVVLESPNAPGGHVFDNFETTNLSPQWLTYGDYGVYDMATTTNRARCGTGSLQMRTFGMGEIASIAILDFPYAVTDGTISWWQYDQTNSPCNVLMSLYAEDTVTEVFSVNLLDSRFQSDRYEIIGERTPFEWGQRTNGWHQYAVSITNGVATLFIDGATVATNTQFAGGIWSLSFVMLTHHGGDQSTWFDLVESRSKAVRFKQSWNDAGAYTMTGLPRNAEYRVSAFRDINHDTVRQTWEPTAHYGNNPVQLTGPVTGIDMTLQAADSDGDGLSDGYEIGYGRYEIITNRCTWTAAQSNALLREAHLATVTSPDEWLAMRRVLGTDLIARDYWLGGRFNSEKSAWTWTTGEAWDYARWMPGQPDNWLGGQNALVQFGSGSSAILWKDEAVTMMYPYILERGFYTDPDNPDTDGDGVSDGQEISDGTLPVQPDSDYDGLTDGEEKDLHTNPMAVDSDGDDLSDGYEVNEYPALNPLQKDSDGDGANDGDELTAGTAPCDAQSFPANVSGTVTWTGSETGAVCVLATAAFPQTNRALKLTGSNACVRIADAPALCLTNRSFTLCAWLRSDRYAAQDYAALITKRAGNADDGWAVALTGTTHEEGPGRLVFAQAGDMGTLLIASNECATGVWHHVAVSFATNTQTLALFADGQPVAVGTNWMSPSSTASPLLLGADSLNQWASLEGMLDDVQIWNQSLPAERLRALAQTPLTGHEVGLVAGWTFNSGTASNIVRGQYDGMLSGATVMSCSNSACAYMQQVSCAITASQSVVNYALNQLPAPAVYAIVGWIDRNANGQLDAGEPFGHPVGSPLMVASNMTTGSFAFTEVRNSIETQTYTPDLAPAATAALHSADWREPYYIIDDVELARVQLLAEAGLYHSNSNAVDGFSPGSGTQILPRHDADWQEPFWQLDAAEYGRVAAYHAAGGYHSSSNAPDGFATGLTDGSPSEGGISATNPCRFVVTAAELPLYQPGGLVRISGVVDSPESVYALVWQPALPTGWQLQSITGTGNPVLLPDAAVWTDGPLEPPLTFEAVLQSAAQQVGAAYIEGDILLDVPSVSTQIQVSVTAPLRLDCDRDADGLADWVETGTGIYVDQFNTGTRPDRADDDGDGMLDGAELSAGTDPNRASSAFLITYYGPYNDMLDSRSTIQSGGMRLEWSSIPGRTYKVLRSSSLFETPEAIATVPAIGYQSSYSDLTAPTNTRAIFYFIQTGDSDNETL
ncbi:MAG: hypothetical protein EOL87_03635 [Spartobacteria bacterium]|nr:hypothetical protein [Spartobacteria bacterium]